MPVPTKDSGAAYLSIKREIDETFQRVLAAGEYSLSEDVSAFEREFATYCGAQHAIGVGSGHDAILIGLLAIGVGPGDEVITPANGCPSVPVAVSHTGAVPRFVDVDERTHNVDAIQVRSAITARSRALLPIHSYGQPCDMAAIMDIAHDHNLKVVEDASLAAGATYRGQRVGNLGDVGIFSLGHGKILNAYGSGGVILTDDAAVEEQARALRQYGFRRIRASDGIKPEYTVGGNVSVLAGYNSRLEALQAAALRVKLRKLDQRIAQRQALAGLYDRLLADVDLVRPYIAPDATSVYRGYIVCVPDRPRVLAGLAAKYIESSAYYLPPLHMHPLWRHLGWQEGDFPVVERISRQLVVLPLYPELSEEQVHEVVDALRTCIAR